MNDEDGRAEALEEKLELLPAEEIVEFQTHVDRVFAEAYGWNLWGAAYLINGGCSDDGFTDFRYGLISRGREFYESAVRVESLAEQSSHRTEA